MGGGSGTPKLVTIVFGLENPTFLAKSDIWIPKCTEGAGGVHLFRKYFFDALPKSAGYIIISLIVYFFCGVGNISLICIFRSAGDSYPISGGTVKLINSHSNRFFLKQQIVDKILSVKR